MRYLHLLLATALVAALPSLAEDEYDFGDFSTAEVDEKPQASSADHGRAKIAFQAAVGYGFRVGGVGYPHISRESESRTADASGNTINRDDHYLNYGQGLKVEIAGDVLLMDNLYGELAFGFTGRVPRTKLEYDNEQTSVSWEEKYRQASFCVKVLAVPTFTILDLLDTHIGFGAGISWTTLKSNNTQEQQEGYVKTRPGLCFAGRLGVDYPLTDLFALTVDVSTELVSYTVTEWLQTNNTLVSTDRNRSSDSPQVARPVKAPGSNVALRVGIRYAIF